MAKAKTTTRNLSKQQLGIVTQSVRTVPGLTDQQRAMVIDAIDVADGDLRDTLAILGIGAPEEMREAATRGATSIAPISPAQIISAAFAEANAGENAHALIIAAGVDQESTKEAFRIGYVAGRLCQMGEDEQAAIERAKIVVALPNSNGKAANRRTEKQETIVTAARKAWSRHLARIGGTSEHGAAGNKNAAKKGARHETDKASKAPSDAPKVAPKFKSPAGALEWAQNMTAALLAGCNKNGLATIAPLVSEVAKQIAVEIAARK